MYFGTSFRMSEPLLDAGFEGDARSAHWGAQFTGSPQLDFELISTGEGFAALEKDWTDLVRRAGNSEGLVFQSHSWLRHWLDCSCLKSTRIEKLAICVGRRHGKVQVICPLVVEWRAGVKILAWMGRLLSQYGDVIVDGDGYGERDNIVAAAMRYVLEAVRPDIVHLGRVREDAAVRPWLVANHAQVVDQQTAACVNMAGSRREAVANAKTRGKAAKNRRRLRRRLEEVCNVTTSVFEPGQQATEVIRTGLVLKQNWLVTRGIVSSAFCEPTTHRFMETIGGTCDGDLRAFASLMTCEDKPVSVQFGMLSGKRLTLHLIAFDLSYEKMGVGVLHLEETIQHCLDRGFTALDLLAPKARYKSDWANDYVNVSDYIVARTASGWIYGNVYLGFARDRLKRGAQLLPLSWRQRMARLANRRVLSAV